MKSTIPFTLAGALAPFVLAVAAFAFPPVGKSAPGFTLNALDGTSHSLADYRGKIVVLEWVNPECPFVRKHYQGSRNIPGLQHAAVKEGVVWLTINSGHAGAQGDYTAEQVRDWHGRTGAAPAAYLRDETGEVGRAYDARHTPTLYIVDASGLLVYAGGIDSINSADPADVRTATNYVHAALAELKSGRPVSRPVTRAYGCGIKY